MKYVVIVNGKPLSGKTTVATAAKEWYADHIGVNGGVHAKSAVDKVYDIYRQLGWDGVKTPEFRKNMSDIKAMYIHNCDGPTRDIVEYVLGLDKNFDQVVFYDCREIPEIEKTVDIFNSLRILGIRVVTLLVRRYDKENLEYGNDSDDHVHDYHYAYEIKNDGTKEELCTKTNEFMHQLFGMEVYNG